MIFADVWLHNQFINFNQKWKPKPFSLSPLSSSHLWLFKQASLSKEVKKNPKTVKMKRIKKKQIKSKEPMKSKRIKSKERMERTGSNNRHILTNKSSKGRNRQMLKSIKWTRIMESQENKEKMVSKKQESMRKDKIFRGKTQKSRIIKQILKLQLSNLNPKSLIIKMGKKTSKVGINKNLRVHRMSKNKNLR